ncbi:MAG: hypothetical protein NZ891_07600, partial [bacterium]|nr:hypothetical protein [bacterium]MDW8164583.1 hypothetical protein [Candidatus Omnitrophota bacterium]
TAKITEKEFDRLRRDFSFFDITISWAINQLTGKPIEKILKEKEKSNWIDIINETAIQKEVLGEKIKELNPKLKTS